MDSSEPEDVRPEDRAREGACGEGESVLHAIRESYGDDVDPTVDLRPDAADSTVGLRPVGLRPKGLRPKGHGPKASSPEGAAAQPQQAGERGATPKPSARYVPGEMIGRGGMAVVLEARDRDLRRTVAMKILRQGPAARSDPAPLSRFLEEAQVTGQLDHPGVVPVHDLGMDAEGRVFFTMQRVKGREFKEIIRLVHAAAEGWTLTRALGILLRVCETVEFAHAKGVLHRDLKPSNVMVGRYGEVYVMDWGLAKVSGRPAPRDLRPRTDPTVTLSAVRTDRQGETDASPDSALVTMDGAVLGTPAYMSPEQAQGRLEEIDERSDLYSIGSMLYHLLAGVPPYLPRGSRLSPHTILAMVVQGPPRPVHRLNSEIPAELCAICEKAMRRERNRRYATVREIADDLRAYLEGRVVRAYRTGAVAEFRKWVQRNRGEAVAIAASILILLGASLAFALQQQRHARETSRKNVELSGLYNALKTEKTRVERAREQEQRARREAERAAALLRRRLDERLVEEGIRERDTLWPAVPATLPAMEGWLARVDDLLGRRGDYRTALETTQAGEGAGARKEEREFLANLLERFARLEKVRSDLLRWKESAERLERVSIEDHRAEWDAALADIASSTAYRGLRLEPQLGLLPLWKNEASGLWEFLHLQSGREPSRAPSEADPGRLRMDARSGIVLVLLPPADFLMGSSSPGEDLPNPDPYHKEEEGPVERVRLDAFFISKFEVTQAQWMRVLGENPSRYPAGDPDFPVTAAHPVENVSWVECREFVRRMDLELPTEARWEYACRAGTSTPFFCGTSVESLQGFANIGDADYYDAIQPGLKEAMTYTASIRDGHVIHAPVGSFLPNPFGLYDMHGNVWEWCRDRKLSYERVKPRPGDGLRETPGGGAGDRVVRGGGLGMVAEQVRSAQRMAVGEDQKRLGIGLRPVRAIR